MADEFGNTGTVEEEFVEKVDPITLAPQLWEAAKTNNLIKAFELIEDNVPVSYIDDETGWTAVNWAVHHNNGKLLKKLLENGGGTLYHQFKKQQNEEEKNEENLDLKLNRMEHNSPLLWAVFKGYQRCVWLLLLEHFSPNDTDEMGNGCLHLAASSGHVGILQAIINDGANPFILNSYKNLPLHVAQNQKCKDMIQSAMDKYSAEAVLQMHADNIDFYTKKATSLSDAIARATQSESPRAFRVAASIESLISNLKEVIIDSNNTGLDEEQIKEAQRIEKKLDRTMELLNELSLAQSNSPINTQTKYAKYIGKLELTIAKAESSGVDRNHLQFARDLVVRSQVEFLVFTALERVKNIECARDADEHDMIRLKMFIQKGQALQANQDLLSKAEDRFKQLESELEMSRAISAVPSVKIPIDNPPEGYWGEEDIGRLKETEEFPLPPADTGEYIWEHSVSYCKLAASIDRLRKCTDGAESLHANGDIIKEAISRLAKVEKDMKILDLKDQEDKRVAVDLATKAAKKLKKGKKGGKKK